MNNKITEKTPNINHQKEDAKNLSIEEVNDVKQFRSLRVQWNALLSGSYDNNIFLTWEWLFNWWHHYGKDKELRILLIKEAGKLIGIVPLMQSKYGRGLVSVNVWENIGAVKGGDYSGVVLTEKIEECLKLIVNYLEEMIINNNIVVRMSHIPENSHFLSALRGEFPSISNNLLIDERPLSSCPYISLPTTWEQYLQDQSRNLRKQIRKKMRLLQEKHKVELKKYTSAENLREQLQILFELHQKRWQGSSIAEIFASPTTREFYLDVSQALYKKDLLNLSFLNVDGRPVSAGWGFNYHNEFCYMTCAFDPGYLDYSVGFLHMVKLIEDAIENGMRKFDFLQGSEAYKFRYAQAKTVNFQITLVKKGLGGIYLLKLLQTLTKVDNIRTRTFRENCRRLLEKILHQKEDIENGI